MITHVVTFRWKPEISPGDLGRIVVALQSMPALVPTIRTYRFGSDLDVGAATNMDFAIVATFDSVEDWKAYDTHPDHVQARSEIIVPWVAERAAVQFES